MNLRDLVDFFLGLCLHHRVDVVFLELEIFECLGIFLCIHNLLLLLSSWWSSLLVRCVMITGLGRISSLLVLDQSLADSRMSLDLCLLLMCHELLLTCVSQLLVVVGDLVSQLNVLLSQVTNLPCESIDLCLAVLLLVHELFPNHIELLAQAIDLISVPLAAAIRK